MYAKLTLNIEENTFRQAKIYAKSKNRSVSTLVEEYLRSISDSNSNAKSATPITQALTGVIKLGENTEYKELLADALLEKYL